MRKRSKYKPKPVMHDPMAYVKERVTMVTAHDSSWLVDVKLKNHGAVTALMRGEATKGHLTDLVASYNMCRQLALTGFGADFGPMLKEAEQAFHSLTERCKGMNRYVLTAQEMNAFRTLLEMHDAQLEVTTVGDIEAARQRALRDMRGGKVHHLKSADQPADAGVHRPESAMA